MTTKEKILRTSLKLFAQNGYEAVSVSQIASELGITKGAIYKHYESKRHIFDSILRHMEQRDAQQAAAHGLIPELSQDHAATTSEEHFTDNLIEFSLAMFQYWTEDEFASDFRKLLTLEQYRSSEMNKLYQQYLASGPLQYVSNLFRAIGMDRQTADRKAEVFYGPMFLFYSCYDGAENDCRKQEIKKAFEHHLENMKSMERMK